MESRETQGAAAEEPAEKIYLDLLKRCLTDLIFIDDPISLLVPFRPLGRSERAKYLFLQPFIGALKALGLQVVRPNRHSFFDYAKLSLDEIKDLRTKGLDWPPRAHTMIGLKRLDNLQFCVETVLREGIEGDLMETGVWRGGASIFMKGVLKAYGDRDRRVWLADSFKGLPPPNAALYPADKGWNLHRSPELAISRKQVEANFRAYGLLDERIRFLEGWFKDTLPNAPVDKLAVLRLDGDLYESTTQALEALYPRLSSGSFLIIDDFGLAPCRAAVEDFRHRHAIDEPIVDIDGMGAYWRKAPERAGDDNGC